MTASHLSSDATGDDLQVSLRLWCAVIAETENVDFLRFCGWTLSQSHVQHRHALALAQVTGVSRQAADNWLSGSSEPGWRSMFAILCATRGAFDSDDDMRAAFMGGV